MLITGAHGMLGNYFKRVFEDRPLTLTGRAEIDIRNFQQCADQFERIRPTHVVHLAAETDVDRCEREPDHAFQTNVIGTQHIARLCVDHDAVMVFVSTTGIFDGKKNDLYTEFDSPNPLNVYAQTKFEAEQLVARLCPKSYIVRAGWVFGGGPQKDKKFVCKILKQCMAKDEISVVNDKLGSPTYALDFVGNLKVVIDSGFYGTYHLTGHGRCSRFDMAREIVRILGSNTRVIPISSAEFSLPATRPRSDAARNYHLQLLGLDRMRPWQEALREYLQDWPASPAG